MTTSDEYHWRETYYIMFSFTDRPTLTQVERVVGELSNRFEIKRITADDDGYFESIFVISDEDHSALEICFEAGDAVAEQSTEFATQLQGEASSEDIARLLKADARLDVMHFEQAIGETTEMDEMFDPSCLLMVVTALAKLTEGIAIDPTTGTVLL